MNEKIKEFLADKKCTHSDSVYGQPTYDEWYEIDDVEIKEFIGLIVQDVLNTMYGEIQYQFSFDLAEEITRSVAKLYDTEFVKQD